MQKVSSNYYRKNSERGTAILVVLSVLTILSVVVLAFVSSMNLESTSANAVETSYRTKMVAHGALSHAIELLRSNIPDPAPISESPSSATAKNWATNPGRLTVITSSANRTHIPLHSGEAPNPDQDVVFDARSTDINRPLPGRSRAPIANGDEDTPRPEMRVAWIPVLEDPSKEAGEDNQMKSRYAFWIDDETSKLNTSVALGKSDPEDLEEGAPDNWKEQLDNGWVTPVFSIKKDEEEQSPGAAPTPGIKVSLGHPWSVNFDTLFEDEDELPIDLVDLHRETQVHGFQRYPDAILRYIDLPGKEKRQWYNKNLWNITFYNRSPEFNAFGFPRLFTLKDPTSLTTGPAYQAPFTTSNGSHLHALYGDHITAEHLNDESDIRKQLTEMTLASGKTLLRYLNETFPGQSQSFADKYDDEEAKQMVLNMLMMSRFATGEWGDGTMTISEVNTNGYANLIAGMNYVGEIDSEELGTPEKYYWWLNEDFEYEYDPDDDPMLPQSPGPHLNEIKFIVKPKEVTRIVDGKPKRYVQLLYHYEVEYYLHPESPYTSIKTGDTDDSIPPAEFTLPFPVRVDYLELNAGDGDHMQTFDQKNWDENTLDEDKGNLLRLACQKPSFGPSNYTVVSSKSFRLTDNEKLVGVGDAVLFDPDKIDSVNFKVNLRLGLAGGSRGVKQMVPLGTDPDDTLEAEFDIDLTAPEDSKTYEISWEVKDPRVSRDKDDWVMREGEDSMDEANSNQPQDPDAPEYQSFKYVKRSMTILNEDSEEGENPWERASYGGEFQANTRFPSAGYLSMLHTGIQEGEAWQTLSLGKQSSGFPDWLLMDLIGATHPLRRGGGINSRSLADHWMSLSYMNSTAGKVNLNNKIYPDNEWFKAPERTKPLKAVFRYLREDDEIDDLVDSILDWQSGGKAFEYVGQLSEVIEDDPEATTWQNETLLRNMANCLTTQSNTFGIWGVAQSVKKSRSSELYDQFEENDAVTSEKRFYAFVERYIWPGRDGVPGNGHIDDNGEWDRLAEPPALETPLTRPGDLPKMRADGEFALIDGPDSVDMEHSEQFAEIPYQSTPLAEADNPAGAFVKYRILYFKFLDH